MNRQNERRVGRHPGKMPGGVKLVDCVTELEAVFGRMTISKHDRASRAFIGMFKIAAGMPFYDPAARDPYVTDWFLKEAARDAIGDALASGQLPVWTDYDGQFVELDHGTLFGPNKWNRSYTVRTGTYVALNASYGRDGVMRGDCDGATLWASAADWPGIRDELIRGRERKTGSQLESDWLELLANGGLQLEHRGGEEPRAIQMNMPQWSLYEAVAWIASSDESLVEVQGPTFREHLQAGREPGGPTWIVLEQAVKDQHCACQKPRFDCLCIEDAREELRAACEVGEVRSTGIPADRGDRRMIPSADFTAAELWPEKGASLHRIVAGKGEAASWFELRFDASDVRKMALRGRGAAPALAPQDPLASTTEPPPLFTKEQNDEWYCRRVAEAKDAGITYSRLEDEAAGKARGIRRERIRDLRSTYAQDWPSGGRKTAEEQERKRRFLQKKAELGG